MQNPEQRGEFSEKESDKFLRKLKEVAPIEKPLSEWTLEEKTELLYEFNNFFCKLPGGADFDMGKLEEVGDSTHLETIEKLGGVDLETYPASVKYLHESRREFVDHIEDALVGTGADLDSLRQMHEAERVATKKLIKAIESRGIFKTSDKKRQKFKLEQVDLRVKMVLMALPAFLRLLDEGYSEADLTA